MNLYYNGLTVQVCSSDSSDLNWLQEFLCPFFEISGGGRYDCRVALIADDQRFEEALERGARPDGAVMDCFALDSACVRLPLWNAPGGNLLLFDGECQVFYLTRPDKSEIEILTRTSNRSARIALMRVIREFAMTHSYLRGGLFIHGAAFSVGDRCVIVAGPKRAGKTTLLMHALRSRKARFVSNDRVLVLLAEAGAIGRGMPTIVTIRKESLEMFPDLYRRMETTSYDFTLSVAERAERATRPDREGRFSLSPAQFCRFLRTEAAAQAQVSALIFPQVKATNEPFALEPLAAELAAEKLTGALFRASAPHKTANLFRLRNGDGPDQPTLEYLCLRLTSQVPCFDCHLGLDVYKEDALATTFIESLIARARVKPNSRLRSRPM